MARLFDDASSEYLERDSVRGATPLSAACWFNSNDATVSGTLICFAKNSDNINFHRLVATKADTYNNKIHARSHDFTNNGAETTTGFSANTWHHACGVWKTSIDRRVYIDGGSKGTNSTDITPANINKTAIGVTNRLNPMNYFSGQIAEVAVWETDLTDAEVLMLAKGYSPLFVRPHKLIAYWPLVRGLNDRIGGYNMTASGTIVSPHPRIIYPTIPQIVYQPVTAPPPGVGIMTLNTGYWGAI